jgi:hypothetical protein
MLVKAVLLFLVVMAVIAWIGGLLGKLRLPGQGQRRTGATCLACGRPRIGKGPCPCGHA